MHSAAVCAGATTTTTLFSADPINGKHSSRGFVNDHVADADYTTTLSSTNPSSRFIKLVFVQKSADVFELHRKYQKIYA